MKEEVIRGKEAFGGSEIDKAALLAEGIIPRQTLATPLCKSTSVSEEWKCGRGYVFIARSFVMFYVAHTQNAVCRFTYTNDAHS